MADPFISGYAIQWQQPANIGGLFLERFARGAFDRSQIENPDVACLWAHDVSRPLGRVGNGTLTLRSDSIGLWYAVTPNPDSPNGQEALASVGRGDVAEVSVGFWSEIEEWDDSGDIPQRLITQAGLIEISLVLWGAYGKATSASLSSTDNAANARRRTIEKMERDQRLRGIR
ncbi:HK97 family phage prohead protease [Mesorhizobium sp. M8A.F.Ca.ET.208.01.1.1]|uniref:HK97 family phage prohead protease n=1 Tax=unclassified Mesorhizobium TaxID=325217 RepID=UPI001093C0C3|nr:MULTISPECIES: HK97 family phage prohead protease [unclassified Mesorhizobium]TGQ94615.1 HK97 family phage prohead protease [Mesorhizobium sp. M8A.F.Ca.ET.208.01.1.1]TGT55103.1 HK97 family phage prohead protease [Mesorhizobium sp. M8A.F.Ca.ET.167.01.1.1]